LLTRVHRVGNANLVYHNVAQVDVLGRQGFHESRRLINTQLFRDAYCHKSRIVVVLKLPVDLFDALLQGVQCMEQLVFYFI